MLKLKLLGVPAMSYNEADIELPAPKTFALLSYLSVHAEAKTRKELSQLFWESGKTSNVRFAVFKLRALLGSEEWLVTNDQFVTVKATTDIGQFEEALREEEFAKALAVWGESDQTFLKGLEQNQEDFDHWLLSERKRLEDCYVRAVQGRIHELEEEGNLSHALKLARILLAKDPLNEKAHYTIMRLLYKRGHKEAALAQFETCRQVLRSELGVEPLEETLALLREIEQGGVSRGKRAQLISHKDNLIALPDVLIGREALKAFVIEKLAKNRTLLHGFGGLGKSALAAAVAETYLTKAPVLWLQAGDARIEAIYDAIASAFNAQKSLHLAPQAKKPKIIHDLLLKASLSLFVLDDVWNAYALSKLMETLPAELPLLVTSRQRYSTMTQIDIGKLNREDSLSLLSHHAQKDLLDDEHAHRLCEVLGDHTFALRIAGINLAVDAISPSVLLERITHTPHSMKVPKDFAEAGRDSVSALLVASLDALSEEAYEAFMAFGILFVPSAGVDLVALCMRRAEEETENALFELLKRGLAKRISEAGRDRVSYQLHDLAFSFAKANNHYRMATAWRACQGFLSENRHDFDSLDTEIGNLLGAAQAAKEHKEAKHLVNLMHDLVVGDAYYLARGHSAQSLELLKAATVQAQAMGQLEVTHYLIARLADSYRESLGDLDAALAHYEKALALAKTVNSPHRQAVMLSLMGITLFQQANSEADTYLARAYRLAKDHQDDLALSQVLQHKGYIAGYREDWQKTKQHCQEAIEVANRLKQDPAIKEADVYYRLFFSLLNLGEAERKLGQFDQALLLREQAYTLAKEQDNQLWMALAAHEIGEMYHDVSKRDLAKNHYDQALNLYHLNNERSRLQTLVHFMLAENYPVNPDIYGV